MDHCVSHSFPGLYPQALPEPLRLLAGFFQCDQRLKKGSTLLQRRCTKIYPLEDIKEAHTLRIPHMLRSGALPDPKE